MGESQEKAVSAALSVFSRKSQRNRLLRLDFPREDGPSAILLPNKLRVHEEVSRGFRIQVEVLSDDPRIPLKLLMGKMVTISLVRQDGSLRYFNGYITEFRFLRSDGGFAFFEMVLEPWLAFARLRKNSVSFHHKSVREITEETLKDYPQADWHMHVYEQDPRLTVANQYNETDYNHLHRRWEALGLHYWYEHRFDGHKLMLSDNSLLAEPIDATGQDDEDVIAFRDKNGSLEGDGIREWIASRQLGSGKTTLISTDYKNPGAQHASADSSNKQGDVFPYEVYEDSCAYGFRMRSDGEQLAARRMVEQDKNTQTFKAIGNDRSVLPGRTFKLGGHFSAEPRSREYDPEPRPSIGERDYLILSVDHEASNNYQAGPRAPSHYENRFTCVRKDIRWRPGRDYNSAPGIYTGLHTATVVGPAKEEIHTDGYGRVKLQFHWDRLGKHDENSSPWIRVLSPAAGHEFGHIRLPRVGEEVAVVYANGNIDHPIILGAVYNGKHMPPWTLPGQHSLSGQRSRELGGTQGNHLILDDTKQKIQAQLKSDHLASQLSLGHIHRIEDTAGRKDARGQGFELRTDGHGALRAQKGLLISTEERQNARAHITDMRETVQRLAQGQQLHLSLSDAAQEAKAHEPGDQDDVCSVLEQQFYAINGHEGQPEQGEFPEFQKPHLVLASPAGIETSTQGSTHLMSSEHTAVSSGAHASISAGKSLLVSVKDAVRMFAYKAGMKLVAAGADIDITALKDSVNILAKLNITHTANRITITAKEEVVINGGTSFTRWNAKGIFHGTRGVWHQHAAQHKVLPGKSKGTPGLPKTVKLPPGKLDLFHQYVTRQGGKRQGIRKGDYTVVDSEGVSHEGTLDGDGFNSVDGLPMGAATVCYGKDPRNPWDESSYFGEESLWPPGAQSETEADDGDLPDLPTSVPKGQNPGLFADAKAVADSFKGEAGKFGAMAQAAAKAASAVQSLPNGGAQAVLAAAAQAVTASVADQLPGAAATAGKPADLASTFGLPAELSRVGIDAPPARVKKTFV